MQTSMLTPSCSCHSPSNTDWPSSWFQKRALPDISDCVHAIEQIKKDENYIQGDTVTAGTCAVEYTSPSGVEARQLQRTAKAAVVAIIDACEYHQGTYVADGPEVEVKKASISQKDDQQDDQDDQDDGGHIDGR